MPCFRSRSRATLRIPLASAPRTCAPPTTYRHRRPASGRPRILGGLWQSRYVVALIFAAVKSDHTLDWYQDWVERVAKEPLEVPKLPTVLGRVGVELGLAHSISYVRMVESARRAVSAQEAISHATRTLEAAQEARARVQEARKRVRRIRRGGRDSDSENEDEEAPTQPATKAPAAGGARKRAASLNVPSAVAGPSSKRRRTGVGS